uniref:NB-ARC domain-containing protein n=1 Tax=Oryza nivara TaxID=4536 RepID=A0A0E0ITN3_ORYNI
MDPHCLAMAARLYSASELSDPSTDDVRHEVRKKKWSGGAGRICRCRRQRRLGFFRKWRRLTASRQRLLSVLFALDPEGKENKDLNFVLGHTAYQTTYLYMETFLSAILSDLASRSISFLVNKCSKPTTPTVEDRLQQLLLRVRIIVEEAEGRLITNQAMLQQLNMLRKEMYKGGSGQTLQDQLQQVLGSLQVTLEDMREFLMFLNSCPRLCQQPYSMHLLLDRCLFGRQMEMEHIMNFLLKEDIPSAENPGVLPIIAPGKVGKSTLIEHACEDERVRNRFSQIVCFNDDDVGHANMVALRDCGVIKHQNYSIGGDRILIIIELMGDIDEGVWGRLYSASKSSVAVGCKIIVTSRSDKIVSFGTTQALRVNFFTQEAYWYFFKVRTFGSLDAEEHPKLASLAMDMAREMNQCFMGSCIYSVLLKANFNARFWSMALARIREFKLKNNLIYKRTFSVPNMVHCYTNSAQSEGEVPEVSMQDFLFGSVKPQRKIQEVHMETFLSVILSDLASRSISLLINKCSKPTLPSMEEKLQRLLLRVRIIVEEAEGRLITNQAMLQQLNMLRKEMYRAYYTLGNFICHDHEEDNAKDHEVSNYFKPSKLNPAKRIRYLWDGGQTLQDQLQQVLGRLQVTLEDMREFVIFLNYCPRLCRQPYSMHLLIDKCLFGRQMEMEHIMNFLLKEDTPRAENPGVLPIIGPGKVGKTTLIAHACDDERVRNHFSQIVCFSEDNLEDASMETLRDSGVIKHQNNATGGKMILIIIELTRDIDEGVWRRLYSVCKSCVANGSKIIVSSRSNKIACFGTAQALRVKFFTQEAYWYFFKLRTFGSMDAEEHPKLESIAMEIAREWNGCFMSSGIYNELLKANFNTQFWSTVLTRIREFRKLNISLYANFDGPWEVVESAYVRRTCSVPNMLHHCTNSAQSEVEVPQLSFEDFQFGNVRPQGKFKVLGWRSHLPPYHDYMFRCENHSARFSPANMEATISVILTELAGRSISFLVSKYLNQQKPAPSDDERLENLQRLLLRFRIIVDEAEERCITNQAMLEQLSILRKEMFRGYYTLDTFRCRAHQGKDHHGERVLGDLENTIVDATEFIAFLSSCPRLHRQPYSMYLILDQCMFGRQTEMEYLINFLLQPGNHSTLEPGVLPIIGPGRVGKSTLVEHACNDERVRSHFSQIVFFTRADLEDESIVDLRDGGVIKHRNRASGVGRVLVIVELDGDRYSEGLDKNIDRVLLERLYSIYKTRIPHDSKIIVTSRSDKIARLGTTPPLRLQLLSKEAYWYFFKVRTFGSMDASEHPEMASIAMDIAIETEGCFMGANLFSRLLRSNANSHYWSLVLATLREFRKKNQHVWSFMYAADQIKALDQVNEPSEEATELLVILDNYQTSCSHASSHCEAEAEAPKISLVDALFGSVRPQGRFDAVGWKSQIAPYYSYMYSCEIQRPKCLAARKNKMKKNGG